MNAKTLTTSPATHAHNQVAAHESSRHGDRATGRACGLAGSSCVDSDDSLAILASCGAYDVRVRITGDSGACAPYSPTPCSCAAAGGGSPFQLRRRLPGQAPIVARVVGRCALSCPLQPLTAASPLPDLADRSTGFGSRSESIATSGRCRFRL